MDPKIRKEMVKAMNTMLLIGKIYIMAQVALNMFYY
jgi:hypothetical protein